MAELFREFCDTLKEKSLSLISQPISVSTGVIAIDKDTTTTASLAEADHALYESKRNKDTITFQPEKDTSVSQAKRVNWFSLK